MNHNELTALIDQVLDGVCSEADFLRLDAELQVNPEARKVYYERMKLDTALHLRAESESANRKSVSRLRRFSFGLLAAYAAGLLFFAGSIGWWIGRENTSVDVAKPEPAAAGFGVIAGQSDAVWENGSFEPGDLLPSGILKMKSGIARLDLFSGVTVVLNGPTEFEVLSSMEMSVTKGKMRAIVPKPARGFRVRTASGDIVDLGTEFAIDVTETRADLHVLDGEIEWHPVSESIRNLTEGDSLRWTDAGGEDDVPSEVKALPGLSELERYRSKRLEKWEEHRRGLRNDSRLLGYFTMDEVANHDRLLEDNSPAENDGVIVRAQRTLNRWEQPHRALDFSPTGSRVRVSIPGTHSALTLMCWVRIDSLDRWYNSLFLTDGHELHEPHWQIMDDGRLFFSVKAHNGRPDKHVAYSPPIWSPALSGQWMHIATVYDSSEKTTTHYVNGKQVSKDKLADDMVVEKVKIGSASIGNWSEPMRQDPHFAVRNLNGVMDEFAIFSVPLTGEEIHELYQKGKP